MEKRGNPLAGKDAEIEMEPLTPNDPSAGMFVSMADPASSAAY